MLNYFTSRVKVTVTRHRLEIDRRK